MLCIDMIDTVMIVDHQRRDYLIHSSDLLLSDLDNGSGFRQDLPVFVMGNGSLISVLLLPAPRFLLAMIADIWSPFR